MIENVEEFSTKLDAEFIADTGVLEDREISVAKTWSNNYVAAQVSEARNCRERRGIEPPLDAADRPNRPVDIRP